MSDRRSGHSAGQRWTRRSASVRRDRRLRTIVLLSCVLALDSADLGTLGAVGAELEQALHIGDFELGVLASVVSLTAATATLPIGWLTDRVPRVPLLAVHAGELVGGIRLPDQRRDCGRALLALVSFWILAVPGFALALEEIVHRLVREQQVHGDEKLVLRTDARQLSPRAAITHLLRIRTNVLLIVASALGYFFLGGARTFGVIYFRGHYHLGDGDGDGYGCSARYGWTGRRPARRPAR